MEGKVKNTKAIIFKTLAVIKGELVGMKPVKTSQERSIIYKIIVIYYSTFQKISSVNTSIMDRSISFCTVAGIDTSILDRTISFYQEGGIYK